MSTDQQILIQSAINGILFGSLFGIMAIGLTLIWGILRIANFAHLSFVLLSAYFSYELTVNYGWDPLQSIVAIAPVMFIFGMAIQWVFERFKVTTFTSLLLTFGLFIVLQNVMTYVWTADEISSRRQIAKDYRTAIRLPAPMDDFLVLPPDLIAFIAAIILGIGIYILLYHTQWGRAVRAMAQDPAIAQSYGVNYRLQALLLSGLATSTASVAGVIIAIKTSLSPSMALSWIGIVVASVILGGLGNPIGAIIAASMLFMVESVWSVEQDPGWSRFISFSVLIFVLFIQPGTLLNLIRNRRTNRLLSTTTAAIDGGEALP
jgi:branched-chain amino acid transport system permease protein